MIETRAVRRVLKSRWVLPMSGPPIEDGAVEMVGERITRVGRWDETALSVVDTAGCAARSFASIGAGEPSTLQRAAVSATRSGDLDVIDCGNAVLMPGLINLHSHMEYTELRGFDQQSPLFQWIPALMSHVRRWDTADFRRSASAGAREYLRSGTTCVVDSAFTGQAALALGEYGLRGVVALELFGVDPQSADLVWQKWLDKRSELLKTIAQHAESGNDEAARRTWQSIEAGTIRISVAPHAPYTVSVPLMRKAAQWARDSQLPYTVHVAESAQEFEWTRTGNATVDNFLLSLHGVVPDGDVTKLSWRGCSRTPVDVLAEHDLLDKNLIAAHCVRLCDADIENFARHLATVAHCPRSNSLLRNGIAPLWRMLSTGVRAGFGTDSAASTEDLSVLNEARFAWKLHRAAHPSFNYSAEKAVRMLTVEAAEAIGMSDILGTLEPGKLADIAVFNLDDCHEFFAINPYDALIYSPVSLCAVYIGGQSAALCR